MFDLDSLAGNWGELTDRLDRAHAVTRWSRDEPALAGLATAGQLADLTRRGCDPARADEVLGSLMRRAATDYLAAAA